MLQYTVVTTVQEQVLEAGLIAIEVECQQTVLHPSFRDWCLPSLRRDADPNGAESFAFRM